MNVCVLVSLGRGILVDKYLIKEYLTKSLISVEIYLIEVFSLTGRLNIRVMTRRQLYSCANSPIQFNMAALTNTGSLSLSIRSIESMYSDLLVSTLQT